MYAHPLVSISFLWLYFHQESRFLLLINCAINQSLFKLVEFGVSLKPYAKLVSISLVTVKVQHSLPSSYQAPYGDAVDGYFVGILQSTLEGPKTGILSFKAL